MHFLVFSLFFQPQASDSYHWIDRHDYLSKNNEHKQFDLTGKK